LYRAATNASFGIGDAGGRTKQLLSFEIEPAGTSNHNMTAAACEVQLIVLMHAVEWPVPALCI
jgi:hypothetical protein